MDNQSDYLSDPILRRDHFARMGEEDWLDFIGRNASVIRYGDSDHIQSFDVKPMIGSQLQTIQTPHTEDKEYWLRELYGLVNDALANNKISAERALAYASIITAQGLSYCSSF